MGFGKIADSDSFDIFTVVFYLTEEGYEKFDLVL